MHSGKANGGYGGDGDDIVVRWNTNGTGRVTANLRPHVEPEKRPMLPRANRQLTDLLGKSPASQTFPFMPPSNLSKSKSITTELSSRAETKAGKHQKSCKSGPAYDRSQEAASLNKKSCKSGPAYDRSREAASLNNKSCKSGPAYDRSREVVLGSNIFKAEAFVDV